MYPYISVAVLLAAWRKAPVRLENPRHHPMNAIKDVGMGDGQITSDRIVLLVSSVAMLESILNVLIEWIQNL